MCDWIQYRNNFRDVVDIRPILAASGPESELTPVPLAAVLIEDEMEVAIDVRRSGEVPLKQLTGELIRARSGDVDSSRIYLEPWLPTSRRYEQALPGGQSDARNRDAVREIISGLFTLWDCLAARTALPEELYVVELGYLLCDYSPHVLELARVAVADHAQHVSSFVLDATTPRTALGFLRHKIFLVYISNAYDNLPTDEVAQLGGRTYIVQTRAYLPKDAAAKIGQPVSVSPDQVPELIRKLLRLGPALLAEAMLAHIGRRKGFDVDYQPFAHRAGTHTVTMTAQVRE
ncbi:MAG: hypothetical protein ACRDRW_19500 [Pseudonocardiaceae bacterium]